MFGGDEPSCRIVQAASCELDFSYADTGLSPQWATDCAAARDSQACDAQTPAACSEPTGARAAGQACADDIQCASRDCDPAFGESCGTCAVATQSAGQECNSSDKQCLPGLYCAGTCVQPIPIGSSCVEGDLCADAAPCVNGTCTIAAGKDQPCTAGQYCAPLYKCIAGTCQLSNLLEPQPDKVCGYGGGVASCGVGYYCAGQGTSGTCQPQGVEGDSCGSAVLTTGPCVEPFVCSDGTCVRASAPSCG